MASYGSVAGVEALLPVAGTLSGSTTPTSDETTAWLEDGYAIINRCIASAGYTIPIGSSVALYNELRGLNNLYAAAFAVQSRGANILTGEQEESSTSWLGRFWTQLEKICASDLSTVGATVATVSSTTSKRRRIRSMQLRRIDGFSGVREGEVIEHDNVSD